MHNPSPATVWTAPPGAPVPPVPPVAPGVPVATFAPVPVYGATPVTPRKSEHGLAYSILAFSLGFATVSLGSLLHAFVDVAAGAGLSPMAAFWLTVLLISAPFAIAAANYVARTEAAEPAAKRSGAREGLGVLLLVCAACVGLGRLFVGVYRLASQVLLTAGAAPGVVLVDLAHVAITVGIAGGMFWGVWRWLYGDRPKPWQAPAVGADPSE